MNNQILQTAFNGIILSQLTYSTGSKVYQNTPLTFFQNNNTDTEFSFWEKDEILYITFRATEEGIDEWIKRGQLKTWLNSIKANSVDWEHNVMFKKVKIEILSHKIKIHKGFYLKSKSVVDIILNEILLKPNLKKIVFCGHSQGGALSQLVPLLLLDYLKKVDFFIDIHTFGSPRVFASYHNKKVSNLFHKYNINLINWQYQNDLVTKLPYRIFFYKHIREVINLNPPSKDIYKFWESIPDHNINNYKKEITTLLL